MNPPPTPDRNTARFQSLEKWRESVDVDLECLRGPLPLEHKEPVVDGVVGATHGKVTAWEARLVRVAVLLATLILGGAGGTLYAVRDHWVHQGVEAEKARVRQEQLLQLELGLKFQAGVQSAQETRLRILEESLRRNYPRDTQD